MNNKSKISYFNANVTTVMSVAMVMLLFGMVAFLGISAHKVSQEIREKVGFDVVLKETATDANVNKLKQHWAAAPYTASVKYVSKEEALRQWEAETGENLLEVLGANPLSSEFEVNVKAQYASVDSLNKIEAEVVKLPMVDSVVMHKDMVKAVNHNIRNATMVLLVVAGMLLLISIALINNAVRMAVYSRRFLIHTMKLVGATACFIRRPFVAVNAINGLVASLLSIAVLGGLLAYWNTVDPTALKYVSYVDMGIVFALMIAVGVLFCVVAAWLATNRYIGLDYDKLFTK